MKFTCTKENLAHVLNLTVPLAAKGGHLPILSNILLQVTESKVEVIGTNLEAAVRATLRAKVESPGVCAVPAKTLSDYVSLLGSDQVEITLKGTELLIASGSAKTKIKSASADEFPVIPPLEEAHGYSIDANRLRVALTNTVIAVAKNEIRPELSGVYFGFFTDRYSGLVMAATDSYRLSEMKIPVAQGKDPLSVIVPARAVFEIIRLTGLVLSKDESETQVRLWVSANQIGIRYDGFEMTARLVEAKYPDYAQIIPTAFKTTAAVPVERMVNSIKAAGLFTTSGVNAVSFDLNPAERSIGVSSTSTQTGEHNSTIEAEVGGEENSILLNHRYVLEGLQHMPTDMVELKMNSADAPCVLQPKGQEEFTYIVMPIRQ